MKIECFNQISKRNFGSENEAKEQEFTIILSKLKNDELRDYLFPCKDKVSSIEHEVDYKISCKILLDRYMETSKKIENLKRMVLNEREKRLENETLANEFLNMKKINEELISKCSSLEREIEIHRVISHKKKNKSRSKSRRKTDQNSQYLN